MVPQPFIFPQTKNTTTTTEVESCGAGLYVRCTYDQTTRRRGYPVATLLPQKATANQEGEASEGLLDTVRYFTHVGSQEHTLYY